MVTVYSLPRDHSTKHHLHTDQKSGKVNTGSLLRWVYSNKYIRTCIHMSSLCTYWHYMIRYMLFGSVKRLGNDNTRSRSHSPRTINLSSRMYNLVGVGTIFASWIRKTITITPRVIYFGENLIYILLNLEWSTKVLLSYMHHVVIAFVLWITEYPLLPLQWALPFVTLPSDAA